MQAHEHSAPSIARLVRRTLLLPLLAGGLLLVLCVGGVQWFTSSALIRANFAHLSRYITSTIHIYLQNAATLLKAMQHAETGPGAFHDALPYFRTVLILNRDRQVLRAEPQGPTGMDYSSFLSPVLEGDNLGESLSVPYVSPYSGTLVVNFSFYDPKVRRYVVGEMPLADLRAQLAAIYQGNPRTGTLFITDPFGNLLAHSDTLLVERQTNVGDLRVLDELRERGGAAPRLEWLDGDPALVLGARIPLARGSWNVVMTVPAKDILGPIATSTAAAMAVLALLTALLLLALRPLVQRRVVAPLERLADSIQRTSWGLEPLEPGGASSFAELVLVERAFAKMREAIVQREELLVGQTEALERKADELEQANRRLQELDAMKSALLSSVSHEMRTPLTSILGFAKLIARDIRQRLLPRLAQEDQGKEPGGGEAASRILGNLEIIQHEGQRLTRMVNDFLDLAKIESGKVVWNDREVRLDEVCRRALDAATALGEARPGVELRAEIDREMPALFMDPDRLEQIILNLLGNAFKFTEAGSVRLSAFCEPSGPVVIEVSDTGPGIPPDELHRVFDKFHQVQATSLRGKTPGSGLGLAICKQIVEHYGGTIGVTSPPGHGATFRVSLPVRAA